MDFFKQHDECKDQQEVHAEQKRQQEYKFLGKIRHTPGHTLFSINQVTGEIKPAQFEKDATITYDRAKMAKHSVAAGRKVIVEKDCFYIEALNKENAFKKYLKMTHRNGKS